MNFILNGEPISVDARDDETLLEVLRDRFGVYSVKDGCAPEGSCGACTVLVDGESVKSCTMFAVQADGSSVTTIEGGAYCSSRRWCRSAGVCRSGGRISENRASMRGGARTGASTSGGASRVVTVRLS